MPARLTLIAHGTTSSIRRGALPFDEALDDAGRQVAASAPAPTRVDLAWSSPATAARETASLLGLVPETLAVIGDWDLGRWTGRTLEDVATLEPDAVTRWLTDPNAAPHDGEPLDALLDRVASWLDEAGTEGHQVAVTHPAVVRAAVVHVMGAPASAFWRVDVGPLGRLSLSGRAATPALWSVKRLDVLARAT